MGPFIYLNRREEKLLKKGGEGYYQILILNTFMGKKKMTRWYLMTIQIHLLSTCESPATVTSELHDRQQLPIWSATETVGFFRRNHAKA